MNKLYEQGGILITIDEEGNWGMREYETIHYCKTKGIHRGNYGFEVTTFYENGHTGRIIGGFPEKTFVDNKIWFPYESDITFSDLFKVFKHGQEFGEQEAMKLILGIN